jgi:hypothetical protein
MGEYFSVGNCRIELAKHIEAGTCNNKVIDVIKNGELFAPVECEIIDYKELLPEDAFSLGKIIRHIVAFYNTYGGYLVFGVSETVAEQEFRLVGCDTQKLDIKQLKDKIYSYIGAHISVSAWNTSYEDGKSILIIFVPRRTEQAPAYFGKEGPTDLKGKFAFRKGETYLRLGDNSVPAAGQDMAFLFGARECRYLAPIFEHLKRKSKSLEHNLPDRNFVCPRFIGRKAIIELLWAWFADEFSYVRVLAGEGGLGKTSIGYEFAQQVCSSAPIGLERVLWVTAKNEQFIADADKYSPVPETHYGSYKTLLEKLCLESAISSSEIDGADEKLLRRFLKNALEIFPTLVIVDDVDSLEKEDQRRVLELAMQLGSTDSRFLLTTRMNLTYSPDIAIEIGGLKDQDYIDYVGLLAERFKGPTLNSKDIEVVHTTTHGSPLFTESLYRLIRRGQTSKAAAEEWRGKKGVEARSAALKREISSLKAESKRVLLAVSILHSCSLTELQQATQYTGETLNDSIEELSSLFLISAPRIGREPRYEVLDTVANLVMQIKETMIPDHIKFHDAVIKLRKAAGSKMVLTKNNLVGNAINEASALLRAGDAEEAHNTVAVAQRRSKYHPDLYLMQAKCYLAEAKPRHDDARRVLQKAYDGNVRKPLLFELWYDAETSMNHSVGALSISELAISSGVGKAGQWMVKKSIALVGVAKDQEQAGYPENSIKHLDQAAESAFDALPVIPPTEQVEIKDALFEIHDSVIRQSKRLGETPVNFFDIVNYIIRMTARKDVRKITLSRLVDFFERGAQQISKTKSGRFFSETVAIRDALKPKVIQSLDSASKVRMGDEEFFSELRSRVSRA